MKKGLLLSALMLSVLLLAGCTGVAPKPEPVLSPAARQADMTPQRSSFMLDGDLTLQAFAKDRTVTPGSDEVFDFTLVNHTGDAVPVVVSLEHVAGDRWRTSLCVQLQCILGDGLERSVSEPFILPPFLEQPFQVHVFVDEQAQPDQATALQVRVEAQIGAIEPRAVALSAVVRKP